MNAGANLAKTGPLPGVTRDLTGFKVSSKPLAYLVDTPGVMIPNVEDLEIGLKLALTGCVPSDDRTMLLSGQLTVGGGRSREGVNCWEASSGRFSSLLTQPIGRNARIHEALGPRKPY